MPRIIIWNLDETGCFWKASGFGRKGHGGKKSKQRFTVALIANAAGEKEMPIVIWRSAKPRCFKGVNVHQLPVQYFNQKKAWMTGEIMDAVLTKLNRQLSSKHRSIALLLDNAGCHPASLKEKYSNIKIVFLPPNTTSKLQPLDLGIIQNFKIHYRKLLMRFVLSKIDKTDSTASEIAKSVDVLKAIRWAAEAWDCVKKETVVNCFRKSGVIAANSTVVTRIGSQEDPFDDVDAYEELDALLIQMGDDLCSTDEYINGDNDLPFCDDTDDETWDEQFMIDLTMPQEEDVDADDEQFDFEPPPPKVKNFQEAVTMLEDIQIFLDYNGFSEVGTNIASQIDKVVSLHCQDRVSSSVQTTIDDFF